MTSTAFWQKQAGGADYVGDVTIHTTVRQPVVDHGHDRQHHVIEAVLFVLEDDDGQRAVGEDRVRVPSHRGPKNQVLVHDATSSNRVGHRIISRSPPRGLPRYSHAATVSSTVVHRLIT